MREGAGAGVPRRRRLGRVEEDSGCSACVGSDAIKLDNKREKKTRGRNGRLVGFETCET